MIEIWKYFPLSEEDKFIFLKTCILGFRIIVVAVLLGYILFLFSILY